MTADRDIARRVPAVQDLGSRFSDHDLTQTATPVHLPSAFVLLLSPPYTLSTSRTNRQHCQYTSDDPYLEAVPVEGFAFIQYHLSSDPAGVAVSF